METYVYRNPMSGEREDGTHEGAFKTRASYPSPSPPTSLSSRWTPKPSKSIWSTTTSSTTAASRLTRKSWKAWSLAAPCGASTRPSCPSTFTVKTTALKPDLYGPSPLFGDGGTPHHGGRCLHPGSGPSSGRQGGGRRRLHDRSRCCSQRPLRTPFPVTAWNCLTYRSPPPPCTNWSPTLPLGRRR